MGLGAMASRIWMSPRSRRLLLFVLFLALIGGSYLFQFALQRVEDAAWDRVRDNEMEQRFETAARIFRGIQRDARRVAIEVSQRSSVRELLAGTSRDRAGVFEDLADLATAEEVGLELYDRTGVLRAWSGESGPDLPRQVSLALEGRMVSAVVPTSIAEQLYVGVPVREHGLLVGAVLLRRTIEIEYPLDNTFVRSTSLSELLPEPMAQSVHYEFVIGRERPAPGAVASRLLYGIDSSIVGRVLVDPPSAAEYHQERARTIGLWRSLLVLLTLGTILLSGVRFFAAHHSTLLRFVGLSSILWLARFSLLILDLPSGVVSSGIFDPAAFASTFGGGLARSLGEMSITVAAFALQAWLLARYVMTVARTHTGRTRLYPAWVVLSVALVLTGVVFWGMRGYGAIIRSAVFDSALAFNDPRSLLPDLALALMAVNLVVISMATVLAVLSIVLYQLSTLTRALGPLAGGISLGVLYGLGLLVFTVAQGNPLLDGLHRAALTGAVLLGGAYAHRRVNSGRAIVSLHGGVGIVLISVLFLVPPLRQFVEERDRGRIELMAREILRPVDAWLSFVVDEALSGLQRPQTVEILRSGNPDRMGRLAFTVWAQSVACREGYAATVVVTDPEHREVSRFSIGGQADLTARLDADLRLVEKDSSLVLTEGSGVTAVRSYGGAAPIRDTDGTLLGYGRIVIAATRRSLFRGENPPVLRAGGADALTVFSRRVTVAEFQNGRLRPSSGTEFPIGYEVPTEVRQALATAEGGGVWWEELIGGRVFTTFYIRSEAAPQSIVALSVTRPAGLGLVTEVARFLVYYLLTLVVFALVSLPFHLARGRRPFQTFRARLLAALVITALLPLVLIGLYGRQLSRERMEETTALRLEDRTSSVAAAAMTGLGRDGSDVIVQISPPVAEAIAADVGADFNLYIGNQLVVSSRPELYDSGLLSRRMNGEAYAGILLSGRRFLVQSERIGEFAYAVGYRPIVDGEGVVLGVVAVPTLYTHEGIEEGTAAQSATLLVGFAILLSIVLAIAALFARRIAAPVQRLTAAMRQIARGDLDVSVSGPDSSAETPRDEVDELMQSFDGMVRDLKRSREELIRYERDVAWNEMARQVVHEIKNPLTPMKLSVQHLRQTYRDRVPDFDQVIERVTRTLTEQIDALSKIASEFASFARMPRRRLALCNVNDVLQEALQLFAPHEGVKFTVHFSYDIVGILADPGELRRTFINIFRNAVQAMKADGTIAVSTEPQDNGVLVRISDDGAGIAPEVMERLFQPNFSTKTEGMGLGLAIVKKTVDDLGGTITIESSEGKGTQVSLFFPPPAEPPEGS
jgi:two-component system nitrogen regulation sensor histidine kinase NtrY